MHIPLVVTRLNLRRSVVGRRDGRADVLQSLELQNLRHHGKITLRPMKAATGWEQSLGQGQASAWKISPIVVIADTIDVDIDTDTAQRRHASIGFTGMLRGQTPPTFFAQAVIGHPIEASLTLMQGLQITEL